MTHARNGLDISFDRPATYRIIVKGRIDQLDFQRAVESVILTTPAASLTRFRNGIRTLGPDNETAIIWEERMDSKVQLLTPNTTVIYVFLWLNLKDEPMVVESPPNVLGLIDDFWFRCVTDFGLAGPDKGRKYLFLPPGYKGKVSDGYFVMKSTGYRILAMMRGFGEVGIGEQAVQWFKERLKVYPLKSGPRANTVVNSSGMGANTLPPEDASVFEMLNEIIQHEPKELFSAEQRSRLATLGI